MPHPVATQQPPVGKMFMYQGSSANHQPIIKRKNAALRPLIKMTSVARNTTASMNSIIYAPSNSCSSCGH